MSQMYNEHNLVQGARVLFKAWNAGHEIDTTPERKWAFVIERAVPQVLDGMMVAGRNAKNLAELLEDEARQGDEGERLADSPVEVVALRFYTGVYCLSLFNLGVYV